MPSPERLRDDTQIVVPCDALDGVRADLESAFTVTVFSADGEYCRIIASPVVIPKVRTYLERQGVSAVSD